MNSTPESAPEPTPAPAREPALERALFGADASPAIVAVETGEGEAIVLRRAKDGATTTEAQSFRPWLLLHERHDLPDTLGIEELAGDGYKFRATFPNMRAFLEARRIVREENRGHFSYGSASKQFLIASGQTLFKGMTFGDIRRMQIDIETTALSPKAPDACIFLIVASDNQGHEEVLVGDEPEILARLTQLVQEWDPDVLEGHNFFGFDLPWIRARAQAHGVSLAWGRPRPDRGGERQELTAGQERNCAIGAISRPFVGHYVWGRHIIDTMFQTQRFDIARGEISSYGLKECARTYHIAEPDRIILDRSVITETFRTDPERVRAYALGDVRETRRLAEIVCPTEFYQTQMVPDTYGSVSVMGSGEKLNSIFIRAYLQSGHAVGRQQASTPYAGGYTEMRVSGLLRHIVKADVESLYPSIMLTNGISSSSDTLGLFLPMLRELTRRRLKAKAEVKKATEDRRRAYWDGLQNSYKLLINSFYGYLGAPFPFNDSKAAGRVTEIGQEIVKRIASELEIEGARVIEIDTDGVYFQPPPGVDGESAEEAFVAHIGKSLPDGIRLAFDGRYAVMLSLKAKNYVLVTEDGRKTFKGSSLRSRADERFGRQFLSEAVDLLLRDDHQGLSRLYLTLLERIENRALGIDQIARRERVTEKTFHSDAKKRAAEAMIGLKVGDYATLYERKEDTGKTILALAADYASDEDIEYYQTKLHRFAQRLEAAIGPDFERLFPKPLTGAKRKAKEDARHQMSLFD